jgi:hypothetical protein
MGGLTVLFRVWRLARGIFSIVYKNICCIWIMDKDRMPPCELFTSSYIVCPKFSLLTYITGQREETLPFNSTFIFGELAKFLFFW